MSKYVINDTTLTAIADAVREKAGTEDLILVSELPTAIANIPTGGGGGGEEIPEEAFILTGSCEYRFAKNNWNWFIDNYGDNVTTKDITTCNSMFNMSTNLKRIPFEINLSSTTSSMDLLNMFYGCNELLELPAIKGTLKTPTGEYSGTVNMAYFLHYCRKLRYIPEDYFHNFGGDAFWEASKKFQKNRNYFFTGCYSLRKLPDISMLITPSTSVYTHLYCYGFQYCYCLDELTNVPILTSHTMTSNYFQYTFSELNRAKNITFQTNEDGSPLVVSWKGQTIDLSQYVGHCNGTPKNIINWNSGITADKQVDSDETYQALKNDPDWFSIKIEFSRYNHDSAVATINSLPDASAYLATAGGTNTIKFKGAAGSATDGGAINTLTEEEIAVATTKGWTVTFK